MLVLLFHGDRRVKARTITNSKQKREQQQQQQQTKAKTTTTANSRHKREQQQQRNGRQKREQQQQKTADKSENNNRKQQTKARTTTENCSQKHYSREWLVPPVLPPYPLTAVFHEDDQGVGRSRLKVQTSPGPHNATASKQGTVGVHTHGTRNIM